MRPRPNWISYQDITSTKKQCSIVEVWIYYDDQHECFTQISDCKHWLIINTGQDKGGKKVTYLYTHM